MKNRAPWLVPWLTLAVFAIFYAIYGLYPFGEKSIVWCDMEQQAVPLLLQLKGILESGESLSYTVLDAAGMNFYGVYFFFLSNPFSYFCLLSDLPIDLLVNVLVPLKLALASATAAIWLRSRHKSLRMAPTMLLALMYGLCGYGLFYYQNIMWLDVQALLPLLLLALDLLYQRQKMLPYILTLCAQMVLCYYLGYMIVLYILLSAALYLRWSAPPAERGRIAAKLWLGSAISALLTAPVWLPSLLQVMHSARSGGLLHNLTKGYLVNGFFDKIALLACTGIVFAVLPFLWTSKLPKSTRMRRFWTFGLLASATVLDPINKMWHTGSYQAFPYRWAILPILLCLSLAAEQMVEEHCLPEAACTQKKLSTLEWVALLLFPLGAMFLCAVLLRVGGKTILSYVETLWVQPLAFALLLVPTVVIVSGYRLVLSLYHKRLLGQRWLMVLCAVFFATECTLNFHCYVCGSADSDALYAQTVSAAGQISDDNFYRVKLSRKYAHANMVGALGYPTMAHYTSLTRADYLKGVKQMGYSSYWMEVPSTGGTVLTDAIWQARYQLGQTGDFPCWTSPIWTDNVLSIAQSNLTLPMGMFVSQTPDAIAELPTGTRADVQWHLLNELFGLTDAMTVYAPTKLQNLKLTTNPDQSVLVVLDDDVLEANAKKEKTDQTQSSDASGSTATPTASIRYSFFVSGKQALYFDAYSLTGTELYNPLNRSMDISVNGRFLRTNFPENADNGLVYLGDAEDEYVTLRIVVRQNFSCESFGVFGLALNPLTEAFAAVNDQNPASVQYQNATYTISYSNPAATDATLVLAIPFDEGFSATVNGAPAPVYRVNTCQTAVVVPPGEGTVVLHFTPSGLRTGCILSVCGLLLGLCFACLRRRIPCGLRSIAVKASECLMKATFVLILLFVYFAPIVIFLCGLIVKGLTWLLTR